jgi:uncharacterized membrane protein
MTHDTPLLLFAAGFLAGVSATILAVRVPDLVVVIRHIARRRHRPAAWEPPRPAA